MDKRAQFFLAAAVACALMGLVGLAEFRGIAFTVSAVYVVFAGLSMLDRWSRGRR
ncbi:MAG: hypothetical protein M3394_02540 [Actinomycetota bacterium]|nr:hypothetical protein [Actinomycetota bacterium]